MKKTFSRFVGALRGRRSSGFGAGAATSTHMYPIPTIDDFDSVLSPYFNPNEPGATIIVTKDGKTLFRKAYGMADLERNIVLRPEMVLRLGSLTKQFTAAAIMLLSDEGKLAVTDDITKFLPDYPTHERIVKKRVEGYSGTTKARSISLTQPYAAGALVSTVDDLAIWDAAISSGKLLTSETWKQIFARPKLKNGRALFYAYGWIHARFKGHVTNEHGGGINGFSTHAMRLPEGKVYVAVLMNNDGGTKWYNALASLFSGKTPRSLAQKAAGIAISK